MIYLSSSARRRISLCNINYSPEGIYHPNRTMNEYDFLYMTEGSWDIIEENTHYPIKKGELLILEPGKHHYSLTKCSPGMRNMFLHCSSLPEDNLPSPGALRLHKLTDCSNNPQIAALFQQIIEVYWSEQEHSQLRLGALLDLLLCELAVPEKETDLSSWRDPVVKNILHLFYLHTERFYSLEELSEFSSLSVRALSGRFRRATGSSVHQYQLALKLKLSQEEISLYPHRGLKDIALSLGFYDEFQFSRLFKRQFGYSPSQKMSCRTDASE